MNLAEAIAIVRTYQDWRLGLTEASTVDLGLHPKKISEAVEIVLNAAIAAQKLFAQEATKPTKK